MTRLFCVFLFLYAPLIDVFICTWLRAIQSMVASTADSLTVQREQAFFIAETIEAKFLKEAVSQFLTDCEGLFS